MPLIMLVSSSFNTYVNLPKKKNNNNNNDDDDGGDELKRTLRCKINVKIKQ